MIDLDFNELGIKEKTLIQVVIALVIALLFQFLIPVDWQPFNTAIGNDLGVLNGFGSPITSLSTWFFALSIAWVIYRKNSYINSLMMYSLIPLIVIVGVEFIFYSLFWDYIHIVPLIVNIAILRSRETLRQKFIVLFSFLLTGLIFLEYYIGIAYTAIPELMILICLPVYFGVIAGLSFFLVLGKPPERGIFKKILKGILVFFWGLGLFLGSIFLVWYIRPGGEYNVNEDIVIDHWVAISEGKHNSNSDMIYWNKTGAIYLVHDRRPFHLGTPDAKIVVWNSTDARHWTKVAEFTVEGEDVRDPKFGIIQNKLFLYFLKNKRFPFAFPYSTVFTSTADGVIWEPVEEISPLNTLFWGPKTNDNVTWYLPTYTRDPYSVILLNSTDGENWTQVAVMHDGEHVSESAIEFLPDGRMMLVSRMEGTNPGIFGSANASTLIATSSYPFTEWNYTNKIKSTVDKLDGLAVFSYNNRTYAAARHQPGPRGLFSELGSIFVRKRTGIYLVNETTGLTYITDIPAQGDTAYCGVVLNGTDAYISYYTSRIDKDYPWILGWLAESDIRIARINLTALSAWADTI